MTSPINLVSVIVPCRNERPYILDCLESIRLNDYGADAIEVLAVDGASDDGTPDVLRKYAEQWPHFRCLHNPQQSAPTALNMGIRNARGAIIMRMDAHCRYPSNYVSTLVKWLNTSGADNVGGVCRTLPGANTSTARAIAIALSHPFGVGNSHFRIGTATPKWVDTVPFGCYRRTVFDRIGLFDEELVKNQDDEFNQRLLGIGGRILLVPEVTVDYYARDSITKVARMYYQYGYFKPLVAKKLGRIGTLRQLIPPIFVLFLAVSLLLGIWLDAARWTFVGILGVYLIALFYASITAAAQNGAKVLPFLLAIFPVVHFSYAFGFLRGSIDFLVRRTGAPRKAAKVPLSR